MQAAPANDPRSPSASSIPSARLLFLVQGLVGLGAFLANAEGLPPKLVQGSISTALVLLGAGLVRRRLRPMSVRLGVLGGAVLATLLVADLALRPIAARLLFRTPHERYANRWPPFPVLSRYEPKALFDEEIYGDLAAVAGRADWAEPRRVRLQADELGFANPAPRPPAPIDLIILGDSFGLGVGTNQEETWGLRVARAQNLQVYNLSLAGSPWMHFLNLQLTLHELPLATDAVVLWTFFSGNDLEEPYGESADPPALRGPLAQLWESFQTWRRRSPLRTIASRLDPEPGSLHQRALPDGRPVLFYRRYADRAARRAAEIRAHKNFPALERTFAAMRRFADAQGLRVAVAAFPSKEEIYPWILGGGEPRADTSGSAFAEIAAELCAAQRFPFLDLGPTFAQAAVERYRAGELLWWRDDSHWNVAGHALAAEDIGKWLASLRASAQRW